MVRRWALRSLLLLLLVSLPEDEGCLFGATRKGGAPTERVELMHEIVTQDGYPVEQHFVTTEDGYILGVHRIPHGRWGTPYEGVPSRKRRVALLMHCLFCSSANFILSGPEEAIAYYLADNGYDVWLGNFRGNIYSRNHLFLSPDSSDFWHFTWDMLAKYDLPAILHYVLRQTREDKLYYIGHSMGTTTFFAMLNMFPHLNNKVHVMIAFTPAVYMKHTTGLFKESLITSAKVYKLYEKLYTGEISERSKLRDKFISTFCSPSSFIFFICESILPIYNGVNEAFIDKIKLERVLSHYPAGTSIRNAAHFGQMIKSGKFQKFDFGSKKNLWWYGTKHPPLYSLNYTRVPVAVIWSQNDWTAHYKDVQRTISEIPHLILNYRVPMPEFNHIDVLLAVNARRLIYDQVLWVLSLY